MLVISQQKHRYHEMIGTRINSTLRVRRMQVKGIVSSLSDGLSDGSKSMVAGASNGM